MKVTDLFPSELEPVLTEWISNFCSLDELFVAIPQLYAKLKSPIIEGTWKTAQY